MANGKRELTDKQKAFIEHYLRCWNASEAARRAGYNGRSNAVGHNLMTNIDIRAEIDARLSDLAMDANEVLARLAAMARSDVSVFLDKSGDIDLTTDQAREHIYLLKKARTKRGVTKGGEPWTEREIELHDPQAALVHIGRHLALFTDKQEVSGETTVNVRDWRAGKSASEVAAIEAAAAIIEAEAAAAEQKANDL
jgi:hypothetical protein